MLKNNDPIALFGEKVEFLATLFACLNVANRSHFTGMTDS